MSITLAIPTYNRTDLLFESFAKVIADPRISEIVIVDDCSSSYVWEKMVDTLQDDDIFHKVKLYRNEKNLDCYANKREAVSKATNEWVILLDSDNVIGPDYLDAIDTFNPFDSIGAKRFILQSSFARPHFDFRRYKDSLIIRDNVHEYITDPTFQTMLNAANYFVNRDEYLRIWDGSVDPVTSDSIYMAYRWLEAGNSIYVVPGMEYDHRVNNHGNEEQSHYAVNVKRTPAGFHNKIIRKLQNMR